MLYGWEDVTATIAHYETSGKQIGVAVSRAGKTEFGHRAAEPFIAASTVKVPLMVELYRQADRGERSLTDRIVLTAEMKAVGSGVLLHMSPGITLTLEDLIYLMISISDNTATNVLIDLAGMDKVNSTIRSLGMTGSNLGRSMKGRAATGDEIENLATAQDYTRVIDAILAGTAASAASCARMLDMLRKQQNKRRIARFLPESTEIDWGSKTGSVPNIASDVGFVRTAAGTASVSIFTEGIAQQVDAEEAIGSIARQAMTATGLFGQH